MSAIERNLEHLDQHRNEFKAALDKYESQLKSTGSVLRLETLSIEHLTSPAISSSLSGRDLELSCRHLVSAFTNSELKSLWNKYDRDLGELSSRLDRTRTCIQKDLCHVDKIAAADEFTNETSSSRLYEPTVNEMLESKRTFEDFEVTSARLARLLDEAVNQRGE